MLKQSDWGKIFKVPVGGNSFIHLKVDEEGGIGYCGREVEPYNWEDVKWSVGEHQHWSSRNFEMEFSVVFELNLCLENK